MKRIPTVIRSKFTKKHESKVLLRDVRLSSVGLEIFNLLLATWHTSAFPPILGWF